MKKLTEIIFYCDNCSSPRVSKKHTVRFNNEGTETIKDVCEYCNVEQEIEFDSKRANTVDKFRIRNEEQSGK